MKNKRVFCMILILLLIIISYFTIIKVFSRKIDTLQVQYDSAKVELEALHSENTELKSLVSQKDNEIQAEKVESHKLSDEEMQKYYLILSQDDQSHEDETETIYIKNNCLYYNGQSFSISDPQKIDDEYSNLLEKFYKLYDIIKEKITDQNLEDAGFDSWFVNAYGFAPFIGLQFDAAIISREYLYKRNCFELAISKYLNNEIEEEKLNDAMNEFIKVREKASDILLNVSNTDL